MISNNVSLLSYFLDLTGQPIKVKRPVSLESPVAGASQAY